METVKERLIHLLEAPPESDIADDFRDRWMVRNATMLIGAASSFMGVFVFMAIGGGMFLYVPAAVVGFGFLVGFALSRRGRRRLACVMAIAPLELALLFNTHNYGTGLFESPYLMCVCIAYLLLEGDDGSVLMTIIAFTMAMICVGCFAWDEPMIALTEGQHRALLCASVCLTLANMATVLFYFLGTRRRSARRLRAALAGAEAASIAKSHFLATMSHEIRTPMNGVIGMLSALEQTALDDRQRDLLDTSQLSSRALLDIINDILDLSKVEAGELSIERNPFNLRTLIETSARLAAVQTQDRDIDVIVDYPPAVPADVLGDAGRIRQVLNNLLGNAVKFTDRGHIEVTVASLARRDSRVDLEMTVTDTGVGIPEEQRQTIFGKFKQIAGGAHSGRGGTGLGLAIVRELVTLMGGSVAVTSAPGRGSRFTCQLPLDLNPLASPLAASPLAAPGGQPVDGREPSARALIVDERGRRTSNLRAWLKHWRIATETCADVGEARAALAGAGHRWLFVDPTVGDGAGARLVEEVRARPPAGPRLAIVLIAEVAGAPDPAVTDAVIDAAQGSLTLPLRHVDLAHLVTARSARREPPPGTDPNSKSDGSAARAPDAAVADPDGSRPGWPEQLRVLVVDDNPINQKVAQRLLQNLACVVDTVASGREALDSLGHEDYELVFMDVQMPDMDGIETTALIRADKRGPTRSGAGRLHETLEAVRDIPIVAMTAHAMDDSRARCLAAGMDGFVSKPVEQRDLAAVLRRFAHRLTRNRAAAFGE